MCLTLKLLYLFILITLYFKVPIGKPVFNSVAYILDDKFQPVDSPGKVGQLFITSPNVAKGYCGGITEARGFVEYNVSKFILLYGSGLNSGLR